MSTEIPVENKFPLLEGVSIGFLKKYFVDSRINICVSIRYCEALSG